MHLVCWLVMSVRCASAAVAALLAGSLLRLLAIGQGLWLDEVWSLLVAETLQSPFEALRRSFDNNHVLISMFMQLSGSDRSWWWYRLPSFAAGLASIALAFRIGRRQSGELGWVQAWVFALSFPLVVYSVEARGYALAIAFALAVYDLYEQPAAVPRGWRLWALWACVVLGCLSHFVFAHFYAAFGLWSAWRCARLCPSVGRACRSLLVLHAVPVALLALLVAPLLMQLRSAGGPPWSVPKVLAEAVGWTLGLPEALGLFALAGLGLAVLGSGLLRRWQLGADSFLFFGLVVLVPPALIAFTNPRLLAARYLLISSVFLLLLLGEGIARLLARNVSLGVCLLALFCAGSLQRIVPFLQFGRGDYASAVRYLGAQTRGRDVIVGSDHDVRNRLVLDYYGRMLQPAQRLVYKPHSDRDPQPPPWLILHSFDQPPSAAAEIALKTGADYRLRQSFPYWGPAGCHWFVYERVVRADPVAAAQP
jgi:hypothetical protein